MLTYIGDSPVVNGTAVSLRLSLGSNVQSATCALVSKGRIRSQTDCEHIIILTGFRLANIISYPSSNYK